MPDSQGQLWDSGEPLKRCPACGKTKTVDDFYRRRQPHGRTVRSRRCKACIAEAYQAANKDGAAGDNNTWLKARLRYHYNISIEQYRQLFEEQAGLCAICGRPQRLTRKDGTTGRLAVDHDHTTGAVRGLLCNPCNALLGQAQDSIPTLFAAIAYLQEHEAGCTKSEMPKNRV